MFTISGWKKLVVLAVLIRLIILPFYFHPDIKTYHYQASFLKEGVVDIYSYLNDHKSLLPVKEGFSYYLLAYFFLGGYQLIAQPFLGGGFYDWLADASSSANEQIGVFRYLFILKLPYLLLDIAIAFLLASFFVKEKDKKKVFTLWLFNPFSMIIIYAYSGFDIIPAFLVLLSLKFAGQGKLSVAALLLGLGAGFKAYPLLFLPLLLLCGKDIRQKIKILFAAVIPFLIIIGPFLTSTSFRQAALTSGQMTRLTLIGFNLGFGEMLMVGVIALAAFFFWELLEARIVKEDLWRYFLVLMLLVFSLMHFHIQWLLWLLPFIVVLFVDNRRLGLFAAALFFLAFLVPILYDDKSMTVGMFSAISPLYNLLPIPFVVLQKVYDPYVVQSILHSVFAGGSLILVLQLLKTKKNLDD